jgi:ankyrin repeat protein
LVNSGAEINRRDKDGNTALDYARGTHQQEVIEYLVSHDAAAK